MTGHKLDHAGMRILWLRLRRPRLAAGVASGVLIYGLLFVFSSMSGRLRFILSWDAGVLVATALLIGLRRALPETMKRIAAQQDAGKWTVLFLTLVAGSASLVAIAGEVPLIRNAGEFEKIVRISLIVATIVLSWAFIHTIFALHYAHDYYSSTPAGTANGATLYKGLAFPGEAMPTYMDFVYFSFTIGMTFQVSDVQITNPAMRGLALTHGIISFFYATGILALTINMVAGLI
ncbi:MAG: DUF1345 domain-containing protein [Betaproteobacteria bacterium]|nr:DUF1345 domain-containing protein [Betaproteobacteria bacterium]